MSKGLTPLEALERYGYHCNHYVNGKIDYEIIESALKEKEQQDSVLKTLEEVIAFDKKLPDIEIDDDGDFQGIIDAVGMRIQRQMKNKERELLRKWVLETCFPKELKALEILKRELMLEVKEDNGLYRLITYQSDNHLLSKKQFDLLKEILL